MTGSDPVEFEVRILRSADLVILQVSGELDCATEGRLAETLDTILASAPPRLVIDMSGVEFIDPAGARPLRRLATTPPEGMRIALRGTSSSVRRVLRLLGVAGLLDPPLSC